MNPPLKPPPATHESKPSSGDHDLPLSDPARRAFVRTPLTNHQRVLSGYPVILRSRSRPAIGRSTRGARRLSLPHVSVSIPVVVDAGTAIDQFDQPGHRARQAAGQQYTATPKPFEAPRSRPYSFSVASVSFEMSKARVPLHSIGSFERLGSGRQGSNLLRAR